MIANPVWGILIGFAVYNLIFIPITAAIAWIFGSRTPVFVRRALLVVDWILFEIISFFVRVITFPWSYRNKRLFEETFGVRPVTHYQPSDQYFKEKDYAQSKVDDVLTYLAQEFNKACDSQENARHNREDNTHQQEVDVAKAAYYDARHLAEKYRFLVKDSFKDYLIPTVANYYSR